MQKRSLSRRLWVLILCCALPGHGFASGIAASITNAARPAGTAAGAAGAAYCAPTALRSLEFQLNETALRLGTSLPAAAAAQYLARAGLETSAPTRELTASALTARYLSGVLARPVLRARVRSVLEKRGGTRGAELAHRLEEVGRAVESLAEFQQLAADADFAPQKESFHRALFDGSGPELGPERFAQYAARLFAGGALRAPAVAETGRQGGRIEAVPEDQELYDRVELSPLTNPERERVVIDLFHRAGAAEREVLLQDAGDGRNNIYVVKPGRTDRVVVVGGHHDKVRRGAGTIDNWTGATMVVNLYQALKDVDTEATYVFVAFAREEEGLLGSKRFLSALSRAEQKKIDSMINLDTLAVDGTFSWQNNSDQTLLRMIKETARRTGRALQEMSLWGGDADSSSFRRAGIPAMTVMGASNSVIWDIVHSANDNIAAFSLRHYKNAYLLVRDLLLDIDGSPVRPSGWRRLARWAQRMTAALFRPAPGMPPAG
ncbi:MAG: M20/M25/M40 family metallo-hydrolase [Elusimicrobiota bacterium]